MATEIIGAKISAPFYGTSIYVWSSVLSATLGGLAVGYYIGGRLSKHLKGSRQLHIAVLTSALLMLTFPWSSKIIMELSLALPLKIGVIVSTFLTLSPVMLCYGIVSPLIVKLITPHQSYAGRSSGTVYSISTIGGVVSTFLFGFRLIPYEGLTNSSLIVGCLLILFPIIYFANILGIKNELSLR